MKIPDETHATLNRLVDDCKVVMDRADAAGRDLTESEAEQIRRKAADFDKIRAKARFAPTVATKADLRARLRYVGLSKSAAERIAAVGWPALSPKASAAGAVEAIRAAAKQLRP